MRSGIRETVLKVVPIGFLPVALVIIVVLAVNLFNSNSDDGNPLNSWTKMNGALEEQKTISTIDIERRASLSKILGIISRYNKTMPEEQKMAIANEIYKMTIKYPNLNVDFICATITHESAKTWDPKVVSKAGALGLMQIMPSTGSFLAVEEGIQWASPQEVLFDPITNIRLGCRYLSALVSAYQKDGGLAAYNGGPRRAAMWLAGNRNNNILYTETRSYVPAVLKLYAEFMSTDVL
jgi:hypothetical protein